MRYEKFWHHKTWNTFENIIMRLIREKKCEKLKRLEKWELIRWCHERPWRKVCKVETQISSVREVQGLSQARMESKGGEWKSISTQIACQFIFHPSEVRKRNLARVNLFKDSTIPFKDETCPSANVNNFEFSAPLKIYYLTPKEDIEKKII